MKEFEKIHVVKAKPVKPKKEKDLSMTEVQKLNREHQIECEYNLSRYKRMVEKNEATKLRIKLRDEKRMQIAQIEYEQKL